MYIDKIEPMFTLLTILALFWCQPRTKIEFLECRVRTNKFFHFIFRGIRIVFIVVQVFECGNNHNQRIRNHSLITSGFFLESHVRTYKERFVRKQRSMFPGKSTARNLYSRQGFINSLNRNGFFRNSTSV